MTWNMKNKILIISIIAVLVSGCADIDNSHGKSRLEAFRDRYTVGSRQGGSGAPLPAVMDTSVYLVAVEFPEGYDWRRDTLYGAVTGNIVLFRNGERLLSVPAGYGCQASLEPDLHHLVGGHVYTETCIDGNTVIGMDGEELFSYPGREFLCGLLVEGSDVYTLGQNRSGKGFSLRRNGGALLEAEDGTVASHLSDYPEYPTGALYRDGERLFFSYWKNLSPVSSERSWFVVEDGVETIVDAGGNGMYDIRVKDGKLQIRERSANKTWKRWEYADGEWSASAMVYRNGNVIVAAPFDGYRRYYFNYYLFLSFRNLYLSGPQLYIGLNPPDAGARPSLWKDGTIEYELDINGFITAVEVVIRRL